jgi:hypothetical protein
LRRLVLHHRSRIKNSLSSILSNVRLVLCLPIVLIPFLLPFLFLCLVIIIIGTLCYKMTRLTALEAGALSLRLALVRIFLVSL